MGSGGCHVDYSFTYRDGGVATHRRIGGDTCGEVSGGTNHGIDGTSHGIDGTHPGIDGTKPWG